MRHTMRTLLAAGLLSAGTAGSALAQQGVDLSVGYTDFTTWTLLGSALAQNDTPGNGFTYSNLILTHTGAGDQSGAGYAQRALTMDFNQAFSFSFHFFIPASDQTRGDGMTFVLSDAPGLGGGGSGLGYEGLGGASVAFAIDTFHFDGEPVSPSLQILAGGSVTPLAATETGLGDAIRDPNYQWLATVSYVPSGHDDQTGTLTGTIDHLNLGSFSVNAAVDFSGLAGVPVYYGFTASNGLATDGHYVTSGVPVAVPEPQSWALMLSGGLLLGWWTRRRLR